MYGTSDYSVSNKEKRKRIHIARDEAMRQFAALSSRFYCSASLRNLKWGGESLILSGQSEDNKWSFTELEHTWVHSLTK